MNEGPRQSSIRLDTGTSLTAGDHIEIRPNAGSPWAGTVREVNEPSGTVTVRVPASPSRSRDVTLTRYELRDADVNGDLRVR